MARYNMYHRTSKYSDEFKASTLRVLNLSECTLKSVAEPLDIQPAQFPLS
jgi:hypothetical protein